MGVESFVVLVVNGLSTGSIYVLIALGLTLVYGVLNIINFAHGELVMIGGIVTYVLYTQGGLSYGLSAAGGALAAGLCGFLVERIGIRPLATHPPLSPLISTIGISVLMSNLGLVVFGADPALLSTGLGSAMVTVGSIRLSAQRLLIVGITALLVALLSLALRHTRIGTAVRAATQDREVAGLMGINTPLLVMGTFVIGALLAGVAGAMMGPLVMVSPLMGGAATLKGFAVVIVGGIGSVLGTVIAGVVVGLAEALTAGYLTTSYQDVVTFVFVLAVLMLRPTGLIAERLEENV
ncbi:MAG: branched-chain amino acid ABC transporter permease [Candidatus Rokubacteria bacterium]|nr:branched-chain amino acid ABC transporter permease [Candidatus Rokubacteria bacterium]